MVTAPVLGAALGAGFALFVAMTIVIYRYYVLRRKGNEWAKLDHPSCKAARMTSLCLSPRQVTNFSSYNIKDDRIIWDVLA